MIRLIFVAVLVLVGGFIIALLLNRELKKSVRQVVASAPKAAV